MRFLIIEEKENKRKENEAILTKTRKFVAWAKQTRKKYPDRQMEAMPKQGSKINHMEAPAACSINNGLALASGNS